MPDFNKYYIISAEPEEVYTALTLEPTIMLWTGAPASFKLEEGSDFSMWDGNIVGKVLSFETGKILVQQWYFGEQKDPSIVTFKFHPHKKGTSLQVSHTNIPESDYTEILSGWDEVFMGDLIDFYSE